MVLCNLFGITAIISLVASINGVPLKNVFAENGLQSNVEQFTNLAQNALQSKIQSITSLKSSLGGSSQQKSGNDYAVQEYERKPSQVLSAYDNSHNKFGYLTNAQPIVDNLREEDKYGNSGDKFYPISRMLVNGYESISNLINQLFEGPKELTRTISRKITDKLNNVGGSLVGLQ